MRKIIAFCFALFIINTSAFAQITLEHSYPNGVWKTAYINLSNSGIKYQWVNVATGELKLYNLDHTLFKSMTFPVISGLSNTVVDYVSETTFDLDAEVEFMVYYQDDNNWANSVTKIINENGTVILDKPGETPSSNYYSSGLRSIFNTPNRTKMILDNHSDSSCKIYSLPGSYFATSFKDKDYNDQYMKSYPNPADDYIKIAYTLPSSIKEAKVEIFSMDGKIVKTCTIDKNYKELLIDTKDFSNGTYFCQINSNGTKIANTKFIVQK